MSRSKCYEPCVNCRAAMCSPRLRLPGLAPHGGCGLCGRCYRAAMRRAQRPAAPDAGPRAGGCRALPGDVWPGRP